MPEVGKKLRKAFIWKMEGLKNEEIIDKLKAFGVPMYKQQLTKIFKRPFYCGIINHGLLDGKVVEGTHEKLISHEIFLKANGIHLSAPGYGVPDKTENEYLPLKVFTKCGEDKLSYRLLVPFSGEAGIRTPGTAINRTTDFESVPFSHSGTSPYISPNFY